MMQDSIEDLLIDDLPEMATLSHQFMNRPGVPVPVPSELVCGIERAIQNNIAKSLMLIRERERSDSDEIFRLRFR